jgi:hypothetical protein
VACIAGRLPADDKEANPGGKHSQLAKDLIGTWTFKFKIKVEGDTFTQTGMDNPYTQVWKRAK